MGRAFALQLAYLIPIAAFGSVHHVFGQARDGLVAANRPALSETVWIGRAAVATSRTCCAPESKVLFAGSQCNRHAPARSRFQLAQKWHSSLAGLAPQDTEASGGSRHRPEKRPLQAKLLRFWNVTRNGAVTPPPLVHAAGKRLVCPKPHSRMRTSRHWRPSRGADCPPHENSHGPDECRAPRLRTVLLTSITMVRSRRTRCCAGWRFNTRPSMRRAFPASGSCRAPSCCRPCAAGAGRAPLARVDWAAATMLFVYVVFSRLRI